MLIIFDFLIRRLPYDMYEMDCIIKRVAGIYMKYILSWPFLLSNMLHEI